MDGFQKIEIKKPPVNNKPLLVVEKNNMFPKKILILPLLLVLILGLVAVMAYFPAKKLYQSALDLNVSVKEVSAAVKTQNIDAAKAKIAVTKEKIKIVSANLGVFAPVGVVPVIGGYYNDATHFVNAGIYGLEAADIAVNSLVPYADLLGLKGKGTFTGGSADQRIQTAVKTFDKITPKLDVISENLAKVKEEVDKVDISRYPEKVRGVEVKSKMTQAITLLDDTINLFVNARPLLKQLPSILGEPTPKKYLVLFQNDKELRATGGFITAYAVFRFDKGKLQIEKSEDIYKLDESKSKKFPAPAEILKYHKGVYYLELRDSNLSPDFIVSMDKFQEMLKSVGDFPKVDGVIALDTHVLVSVMKVLGSIPAYGTNFTVETDKRCDCPQVIYELEKYADKPVAYERGSRKDILGVLLYQIMQKALGVSPGQYWGKLFQVGLDEMQQKHILFYLKDAEAQKGIEALNFAGRVAKFDGDYLNINNTNFAGAKSNMFVSQAVKVDTAIGSDGSIEKTVSIDYKNPYPPSDCGLESGGLCLNAVLRNWIRVYVPKGSQLLDFKGSEVDVTAYESLDKTVFDGFLTVKPMGVAKAIVRYKLPFKIQDGKLPTLIQKQPGTDGTEYLLTKNGKQVDKFILNLDKELIVKN
ncbi:MAG: hypothetical protein UT63_C0047G0002 [Candidatus Gottesmanbacteria bacterium GW2011_GWC2_39_8]|uniref:DUF4012 domain-containing protein n=1 Tax=Candidatus Gottesmanbacteria bacterium GW2011_GWC2_39_8 TaxID=1618450 RepID=A0A0G0Q4J7_9BACT|nr:MAG: hypothetical protein UT63_C0047G0002 [Candidatus Gottesmanbacteria bacterium GW2011_GWC2_39_8]